MPATRLQSAVHVLDAAAMHAHVPACAALLTCWRPLCVPRCLAAAAHDRGSQPGVCAAWTPRILRRACQRGVEPCAAHQLAFMQLSAHVAGPAAPAPAYPQLTASAFALHCPAFWMRPWSRPARTYRWPGRRATRHSGCSPGWQASPTAPSRCRCASAALRAALCRNACTPCLLANGWASDMLPSAVPARAGVAGGVPDWAQQGGRLAGLMVRRCPMQHTHALPAAGTRTGEFGCRGASQGCVACAHCQAHTCACLRRSRQVHAGRYAALHGAAQHHARLAACWLVSRRATACLCRARADVQRAEAAASAVAQAWPSVRV